MKFTEITTDKGTYRLTKMIEYGQEINSADWCYNYCMAIGPNAETRRKNLVSDGTLWEVLTALYFRWTCLPDCAVPELDADYRRNNRRLS